MPQIKPYDYLFDTNPVLRLVVPYIIGIVTGEYLWKSCSGFAWLFWCISCLFVFICLGIYKTEIPHARKYYPFILSLSLGMIFLGLGADIHAKDKLQVVWPESAQNYKVVVVETPKQNNKIWQVNAKIWGGKYDGKKIRLALMKSYSDSLDNKSGPRHVSADDAPFSKKVSDRVEGMSVVRHVATESSDSVYCNSILSGDALLIHAAVERPHNHGNPREFDFVKWMEHQGIAGTAFCLPNQWKKSVNEVEDLPLSVRALRLRDQLVRKYDQYFDGRNLAILSAMTLGDKTRLDQTTRELFSQTGVSHILALSGLHLSILFCIYKFFVLSLCRRRIWYVSLTFVGVAGLWVFAVLAGFPISLIRATFMFSIVSLLGCLRRDSFSINNLSLAALILLIISPQALFDVGFQLSFISVFFIVLYANWLTRCEWLPKIKGVKVLFGVLSTTFCAQLATAPLVAYCFHIFPIYGFLANFVAIPCAYGILGSAIIFFLVPILQPYIAMVLGFFLWGMDEVLTMISKMPGAVLDLYPTRWSVGLFYVMFFAVAYYFHRRKVIGLYTGALVLMVMAGTELYVHRPHRMTPQLVFYNLRSVPAIHCLYSEEVSYLWSTNYAKADSALRSVQKSYWKEENIQAPFRLKTTLNNGSLYYDGHVLAFDGRRIGLGYGSLPKGGPISPLNVDYLYLVRGARADLKEWLDYFHPKILVLDASLTDFYQQKYSHEADSLNVSVYDIETRGALVVK